MASTDTLTTGFYLTAPNRSERAETVWNCLDAVLRLNDGLNHTDLQLPQIKEDITYLLQVMAETPAVQKLQPEIRMAYNALLEHKNQFSTEANQTAQAHMRLMNIRLGMQVVHALETEIGHIGDPGLSRASSNAIQHLAAVFAEELKMISFGPEYEAYHQRLVEHFDSNCQTQNLARSGALWELMTPGERQGFLDQVFQTAMISGYEAMGEAPNKAPMPDIVFKDLGHTCGFACPAEKCIEINTNLLGSSHDTMKTAILTVCHEAGHMLDFYMEDSPVLKEMGAFGLLFDTCQALIEEFTALDLYVGPIYRNDPSEKFESEKMLAGPLLNAIAQKIRDLPPPYAYSHLGLHAFEAEYS